MASAPPATGCKVVLANSVAQSLLNENKETLAKLSKKPLLVGFLANEDPAAKTYAEYTGKTCLENGFDFELRNVSKDDIEEAIVSANTDDKVQGIIVYYPIFPAESRRDQYIQSVVSPKKDVEGLCHTYIFNMYQNVRFLDAPHNTMKSILPCTPLAVIKVLEYLQIYNSILPYGNRLYGRTITVINRSEVVGRPLAALLANDGATVYSVDISGLQMFTRGEGIKAKKHECHDISMKLEEVLPISDVVISGVPGNGFKVPLQHLKNGAVCINFSSEKNFTPEVKQKASIYVPAIGKVTIAILLRNILRLAQIQDATSQSVLSA
ncbi:hypothetical protein BP6252_01938 [Coleophoma cylindrospora]|uniref:Methylenetetrahydrofolate dehydrogenase [NAD(+)] n=1 Tax=Coleophoma cylindrospora TaxID=1849047 RepID=A0A3D8SF19_9HELO|nr:hypothetical protein BP6252_01938 [Coleophoma cylindrospora]